MGRINLEYRNLHSMILKIDDIELIYIYIGIYVCIIWYTVNIEYQTVLISCTKPNSKYRNIKILLPNFISNTKLPNTNYQFFLLGSVIQFLILYAQP